MNKIFIKIFLPIIIICLIIFLFPKHYSGLSDCTYVKCFGLSVEMTPDLMDDGLTCYGIPYDKIGICRPQVPTSSEPITISSSNIKIDVSKEKYGDIDFGLYNLNFSDRDIYLNVSCVNENNSQEPSIRLLYRIDPIKIRPGDYSFFPIRIALDVYTEQKLTPEGVYTCKIIASTYENQELALNDSNALSAMFTVKIV